MEVVKFENVSKFFEGVEVLKNITFSVEEGERVVLFGPSGSGKTTVLRLIAGFISPDSGKIFLYNKLASDRNSILIPPERRNVGMVFQDLALWPHFTVWKNIEFGLKVNGFSKKERNKRVGELLEMVGLEKLKNRKPSQLSGGEKQRVAIARALALMPRILLMDEPLSSLDFELKDRLRDEMVRLQENLGFTLIYVTHDREELERIATRKIFLKNGQMVKG